MLEWNIQWIGAPEVWNRTGRGEETVYANADTGVLWKHETLFESYIGTKLTSINHNYAWWDGVKLPLMIGLGPCKVNSQEPCDDNGHGTHTTRYNIIY